MQYVYKLKQHHTNATNNVTTINVLRTYGFCLLHKTIDKTIVKTMRIWHEELIPKLCQKHLCAMWREGLGCLKIVQYMTDGGGYKNHPAVKEFMGDSYRLVQRLYLVRQEMLKRGYHPKELVHSNIFTSSNNYQPWQTLNEQIQVLKSKHCQCQV